VFSVDAVGFGRPPLEHFADTRPYQEVFQDWSGWIEQGQVDLVCRMGYKREWVEAQAGDFRGWADYTRRLQDQCPGRYVTIGIGGHFNPPSAVVTQYREAIARKLGTSLFSYHRPTRDDVEVGKHGYRSSLWDVLGGRVYPAPVEPPKPRWRQGRAFIAGFVTDASGNVQDGKTVTLAGAGRSTHTDGSGFFAFFDLPPVTYKLQASGTNIDGVSAEAKAGRVTWVTGQEPGKR
jgi:hypothetical protein